MSELALYRKYRSRNFKEVVGQKPIITTLTNALSQGRTSHAYLFTGPRGVGKTTVARLLAQGLNCTSTPGEGNIPCNQCEICLVPLGSNLDIYEIDAASNRRIDEIRDLRDKIGLAPSLGRYKVYIIDEVHMLTTEAFNALLKTLEEPPSHAVFILATTEAHKLPETIISRTQRFSFRPITRDDLESHLITIAEQEKIKLSPAAATVLAEASKGSFRDAISLLDQVASTNEATIEAETVRMILGWSDEQTIDRLSLAIANSNPAEALHSLDQALEQGAQISQVINQLISRWRSLMLIAAKANKSSSTPAEEKILATLDLPQIVNVISLLTATSQSNWPQLALESTLVKLAAGSTTAPTKAPVSAIAPAATPAPTVAPTVSEAKEPSSAATNQPNPELWPKALLLIKSQNNSLYALLRSCKVVIGAQVVVSCRFKFHRDRLQEPKNRQVIETALQKVYGSDLKVVCQLDDAEAEAPNQDAELVSSALEIFGGEIVDD